MHTAAGASDKAPFGIIPSFEITVFEKVSQQQLVDQVSRQIKSNKQQQPELESKRQGQDPPYGVHDLILPVVVRHYAPQSLAQHLEIETDDWSPSGLAATAIASELSCNTAAVTLVQSFVPCCSTVAMRSLMR